MEESGWWKRGDDKTGHHPSPPRKTKHDKANGKERRKAKVRGAVSKEAQTRDTKLSL